MFLKFCLESTVSRERESQELKKDYYNKTKSTIKKR